MLARLYIINHKMQQKPFLICELAEKNTNTCNFQISIRIDQRKGTANWLDSFCSDG